MSLPLMSPRATSLPPPVSSNGFPNPLVQPRRSQAQIIVPDAPLTPPMSPGHSENGDDSIVIDAEPRYSGPETHGPHSAVWSESVPPCRDSSDMEVDLRPAAVQPQPPLRILEDEQVHLQRTGLRLTDFEVTRTLGSSVFSDLPQSADQWGIRYWNICSRFTGPPS